jgi:TP901 family phage tail tape measure protein
MINASRSVIEVGVAMVLRDRFSQEAGKISGSFRTMMNDMNTWNRGIQMSASNSLDFGRQLVGGMARAYKYSAGVQNEVWTASKIAGATIAEQKEMLQLAKDVNAMTPLTASDVASGQRYLAMAGNKFDAIKEMIGPASKLASIFTMPVGGKGGVADLMTNIMSMYQIPMTEAARVTDDLYTAVTNANISLQDLAQSISYAGADMATAGVDLRQTAAAIGVLGDMGIQGSMAGTSLANMIRYLQLSLVNQKKKGYNALADMGLSPDDFFDAQGNLIDLYSVYQKFAKAAADMPSRVETPTFFNIFGVRGNRGMLPVLRDIASGRDKMGQILATYNKNMGAVNQMNEERLKTDAGVIDQWESSLENLTVTAGAAMGRVFTPVLQFGVKFLDIVNSISETWGGSFALRVAATGVVVGTIVAGFRTVRGVIRSIGYLQTIATASTEGMSAAAIKTNTQFAIMEAHMVSMVNLMRTMVQLQMMSSGIGMNSKGRFYNMSNGRYVKTPNPGVPMATTMAGNLMGGAVGGAAANAGSRAAGQVAANAGSRAAGQVAANAGSRAAGQVAAKGLTGMMGRFMGFLGGPWGLAISIGLPLLIEVGGRLISSIDKNTDAQNNKEDDPLAIRAQNEERFINAMKSAIRDGLKEGKIGITIDGQSMGDYSLGSQQDYTGVVLGL